MNFQSLFVFYLAECVIVTVSVLTILPIFGLIGVLLAWKQSLTFKPEKLIKEVQGKHCLVAGGTKGLGAAVAHDLVMAGAHVTIVSRSPCQSVLDHLMAVKRNSSQIIQSKLVDLSDYEQVVELIDGLFDDGHSPFWAICNAGSANAGFIADQLPSLAESGKDGPHDWMMDSNYKTSVNVVRAILHASKKFKSSENDSICGLNSSQRQHLPARIVFVGSILSVLSFVGYSAYSASKYALFGLAVSLRSEFAPLGTKVSIYLPGSMDTSGYQHENIGKPDITKEIEGASSLASCEDASHAMLAGVLRNKFSFSNDVLGELARISVNGGAPRSHLIFEILATPLLAIIFSVWSILCDADIVKHFKTKKNKSE